MSSLSSLCLFSLPSDLTACGRLRLRSRETKEGYTIIIRRYKLSGIQCTFVYTCMYIVHVHACTCIIIIYSSSGRILSPIENWAGLCTIYMYVDHIAQKTFANTEICSPVKVPNTCSSAVHGILSPQFRGWSALKFLLCITKQTMSGLCAFVAKS